MAQAVRDILKLQGWRGVRQRRVEQEDPQYLAVAQNAIFRDPVNGGAVWPRRGFARLTDSAIGSGTAPRTTNLITEFVKLDGTRYHVLVVSGIIYTASWSGSSFTTSVSAANFATAGITVSATSTWSAVALNNQLVISDGTNTPFMWDGTTGAGGLTSLSNAPAFYGQITVYYAKVVGIKAADRTTIVWSEENDPTTGYEAGGYNNAWTLGQSDTDPLVALAATNDALYYGRISGISVITGAVTPDFASTGVRNAISDTLGVGAKFGMFVSSNGVIWFVDQYARPHRIVNGQVEEIWRQIESPYVWTSATGSSRDTGDAVPTNAQLASVYWVGVPLERSVCWCWAAGNNVVQMRLFDEQSGQYLGTWVPTVFLLDSGVSGFRGRAGLLYCDRSGYEGDVFVVTTGDALLYSQGTTNLSLGYDHDASANSKIFTFDMASPRLGYEAGTWWQYEAVRMRVVTITAGNAAITYRTENDASDASQDVAITAGNKAYTVGIARAGSAVAVGAQTSGTTPGEAVFGVTAIEVERYGFPADPAMLG